MTRFYKHTKRGYFNRAPGRGGWCFGNLEERMAFNIAIAATRRPRGHSFASYSPDNHEGSAFVARGSGHGPLNQNFERPMRNGRWTGPWRSADG